MKKSLFWLITAVLILSVGIGGTLAYFIASSQRVENTFTVGDVQISLTETTGSEYKILPGTTLMKDPYVTVQEGSDACWLFVQVDPSQNFELYCTFDIRAEWIPLSGTSGVYYQSVEATAVDRNFRVLKNDRIYVRETLTEEMLNAIAVLPKLDITAYAVQREGIATPEAAWQIVREEAV